MNHKSAFVKLVMLELLSGVSTNKDDCLEKTSKFSYSFMLMDCMLGKGSGKMVLIMLSQCTRVH